MGPIRLRTSLLLSLLGLPLVLAGCHAAVDPPALAAEPEPELSELGRRAYDLLRAARRFTDAAIYDDGAPPREVIALRLLLREPDGARALRKLADEATLGGQLYATCGLFYADPQAFERHVARFAASAATVFYQSGCIGYRDMPIAELVASERPETLRLASNRQGVRAWCEANGKLEGGYWLDIRGGGIPSMLLDQGGFAEHVELDLAQGVD